MRLALTTLYILLLTVVIIGQNGTENSIDIREKLRLKYYDAVQKSDSVDALVSLVDDLRESGDDTLNGMLNAYDAGILSLRAKHAFWPFSKLSYLKDSMRKFDNVIDEHPGNIEIRFMRYSILHYVPGFLGWNSELQEDQRVLLEKLGSREFAGLPEDLITGITQFLIDSGRLSDSEEERLRTQVLIALEK